ncbi:LytTR family DNA-binding domain-containing protein [uncultured Spirosoma sp.]|uniref:LytR/AlgR family response regulator transcription factor n=1 Tax=uncultured Spirosoma sp. TaxID=278208 RepID=UPI002589EDD8|nr:LytTR family DNA-binding domain-containing protein [uncultured Spirosoma sp.]
MLRSIHQFLNRPVAEDFGFTNQVRQSLLSGVYVFAFVYLFGGGHTDDWSRAGLLALFGLGCVLSTLVANWLVPSLLPALYDEDRWTVGRQIVQVLFVLLCVSVGNMIVMWLLRIGHATFWEMYASVTLIGFFPISVGVFINEQRRLKRNLAHAQLLNQQLARIAIDPSVTESVMTAKPEPTVAPIVLSSENGRDKLSLPPDQLRYVESVGNYVDVYWLHTGALHKTVLRSTLKEIEATLASHPDFLRCHRAFLVNLRAVSHADGNARGYQLTLTDVPNRIPVSRSFVDTFDARFDTVARSH